jgi:hypothetical protein
MDPDDIAPEDEMNAWFAMRKKERPSKFSMGLNEYFAARVLTGSGCVFWKGRAEEGE